MLVHRLTIYIPYHWSAPGVCKELAADIFCREDLWGEGVLWDTAEGDGFFNIVSGLLFFSVAFYKFREGSHVYGSIMSVFLGPELILCHLVFKTAASQSAGTWQGWAFAKKVGSSRFRLRKNKIC